MRRNIAWVFAGLILLRPAHTCDSITLLGKGRLAVLHRGLLKVAAEFG
jgi:hypothetical protein